LTCGLRIRDYSQLRAAIAARRRQLGLRQRDADEICGLQPGYLGKIEKNIRKLGDLSLPMVLAGLDCDLYLAPRGAAAPVIEQQGSAAGDGYEAKSRTASIISNHQE
jgi:hypothetical protein